MAWIDIEEKSIRKLSEHRNLPRIGLEDGLNFFFNENSRRDHVVFSGRGNIFNKFKKTKKKIIYIYILK